MLNAQNKNQVLKWSQRQLGAKARLVSVSEETTPDSFGFVEKDGTGITKQEASGCRPVLSIMANIFQNLPGVEETHMDCVSRPKSRGKKPTIH